MSSRVISRALTLCIRCILSYKFFYWNHSYRSSLVRITHPPGSIPSAACVLVEDSRFGLFIPLDDLNCPSLSMEPMDRVPCGVEGALPVLSWNSLGGRRLAVIQVFTLSSPLVSEGPGDLGHRMVEVLGSAIGW